MGIFPTITRTKDSTISSNDVLTSLVRGRKLQRDTLARVGNQTKQKQSESTCVTHPDIRVTGWYVAHAYLIDSSVVRILSGGADHA